VKVESEMKKGLGEVEDKENSKEKKEYKKLC